MNEIITTQDSSPTLFSELYHQTYHSKFGAVAESTHVFIQNGLLRVLEEKKEITLFELGFGTGLNVYLTLLEANKLGIKICYHSIEKHIINDTVYHGYRKELSKTQSDSDLLYFDKIYQSPWGSKISISNSFELLKINGDLMEYPLTKDTFDLVYYDAFSPNVQPELWQTDVFKKFFNAMTSNSLLSTYCAKGQVKRDLKKCGFDVLTTPGPFGKREMTLAFKKSYDYFK